MNSPTPQRRAVIDIGTNSVKLLVADVAGARITPVSEVSNQTRLGAGFYATHQLQRAAIAKTAAAAAKYSAQAAKLGASSVRIIGTSAARDALNGAELAAAICQASGLPIEILSGEQEAEWVFRGVASDPKLARLPVLILDVGGGSTEFIVGENAVPRFCRSYPLGTVRLLEQLQPGDPPGLDALSRCRAILREFLDHQVVPALEPALRQCAGPAQFVGTSGHRLHPRPHRGPGGRFQPRADRSHRPDRGPAARAVGRTMATASGRPPQNTRTSARPRRRNCYRHGNLRSHHGPVRLCAFADQHPRPALLGLAATAGIKDGCVVIAGSSLFSVECQNRAFPFVKSFIPQSQRDWIIQPSVGPTQRGPTLGFDKMGFNPERVAYQQLMQEIKPFQGLRFFRLAPWVARSSQPRADSSNPFGIAFNSRHRPQTASGIPL